MNPRPLQPSMRKMFATYLAISDPRCFFEQHNLVEKGQICPRCRNDINSYLPMVPTHWPAS